MSQFICYHALLLTLLSGCAATRPAPTEPAEPEPTTKRDTAPPPRWPFWESSRAWPNLLSKPFRSKGHFNNEAFISEIRVNPRAHDAYLTLVADSKLPVGSIVLAAHETEGGKPGPIFAMEKGSEEWLFRVIQPDGTLNPEAVSAAAPGLKLCQRCHAEAPADFVFGLPRPEPSEPATATGRSRRTR